MLQTCGLSVEDQHPLKQGLKHQSGRCSVHNPQVEDQHPLKQGLKQNTDIVSPNLLSGVEDQHPLKQGLKHLSVIFSPRDL